MLSTCSGFLTRYVKPLFIAVTGILVMTLSFYFASRFTLHTTHAQIMLVLYLRGFGMGLTFAPLNDFSLMNLSQCDMASAAGISNSIKQLSGQRQHRPAYRYSDRPYGVPFGAGRALFGGKLRGRYLRRFPFRHIRFVGLGTALPVAVAPAPQGGFV